MPSKRKGINAFQLASVDGRYGGVPFVVHAKMAAGDSDTTVFENASFPVRVIDAWAVQNGSSASGDTWKVTDGTNDITAAVDIASGSDKDVTRAASIDDAYWDIDKGGEIHVETASGALVDVFVKCVVKV